MTTPPPIEILTGFWEDILPHADRVFVVSSTLDLFDVATRIATDDVPTISAWITSGAIRRPLASELQAWSSAPTRPFRFSIVQPYVVIQEVGH